ncbi:dienelactone hydrolase family protein [Roseicella aerolata]|uniref:Dienelactone hydrolase n=1 Tax=Roseicella aerolata TaxID=2883479 RepID=A0A9X1L7Q5_9PROT|nr:hypothetical protein [Roseicella aerolata]MCB4822236.1 hypothetical protein [Roseicella aerolata]
MAPVLVLCGPPAWAGAAPDGGDATEVVGLTGADSALLTLPPRRSPDRPMPVVLLLPDADGPGPRTELYGRRLLENGIALLELPGGEDPENGGLPPSGPPLAPLLAAIAADPRLDARQVALMALGEGARRILPGLAAGGPVAALVLLYPGCDAVLAGAARRVGGAPRILLLHGDEDAANDPGACAAVAGAFPAQREVRHRVLAGAGYGWDAYAMVRPGGAVLLPHPAGNGRRAWSQPDARTTEVAADRVLGFILAALAGR